MAPFTFDLCECEKLFRVGWMNPRIKSNLTIHLND